MPPCPRRFSGNLFPLLGRQLFRPSLSALQSTQPSKSDCGRVLLFGWLGIRHNGVENVPGYFRRVFLLA